MKLSDIKGEDALEVLADILEPAMEIIGDEKFKSMIQSDKQNPVKTVQYVLKNHKKSILHILALLDGEDPETYNPSALKLPAKLLEVFSDPELKILFS